MSKRKSINLAAIGEAAGSTVTPIAKLEAKAEGRAPSRQGKVQIAAHVDPSLRQRVKILHVQQDRPVNDLMIEAVELLLQKYGG